METAFTLLAFSVICWACQSRQRVADVVAVASSPARLLAVAGEEATAATEQHKALAANFLIIPGEQVGLVRVEASEASLIRALGKANVVRDTIYTVDGQSVIGTTLYRNTADQAQIEWRNKGRFAHPERVFIRPTRDENEVLLPGRTGRVVHWKTADGLQVGSTLRQVEAINGTPFTLYGFEWAYGGQSSGWKGGHLQAKNGKTFVVVTFGFDQDVPANQRAFFEAVSGDTEFLSNNTALQQLNPTVQTLIISFQ